MRYMRIYMEELFKLLISRIPAKNNSESFYFFVKKRFSEYEGLLSAVPEQELNSFLKECKVMKNPKKKTFVKLIKIIHEKSIAILSLAYKGNLMQAMLDLERLLTCVTYTDRILKDSLVNYFYYSTQEIGTLYRCVDFSDMKIPPDCNHLPFNLRYKASRNRFNQLGTICMYLSSSLKSANAESGDLAEGKKRWYGTFSFNKLFYRSVLLLNMKVPTHDDLERISDRFSFLLLYPFYILCLTSKPDSDKQAFKEEYLFSQLFFHLLFYKKHDKMPFFDGIIFTSTKDSHEFNIVIPAKYDDENPPKSGHSEYIKDILITETKPTLLCGKI